MKLAHFACVPALVLAVAGVVRAQEAPAALTLQSAIDRGLAASHRLGELKARQAGAEAAIQGTKAAKMPQASAIAGYTRTNHVDEFGIAVPGQGLRVIYPDIPDNYRARLDLQWPIYTFGRTDALERAARAESQAYRSLSHSRRNGGTPPPPNR